MSFKVVHRVFHDDKVEQTVCPSSEDGGQRLDAWLSARFTMLSRRQWQNRISQGGVSVNDRPAKPSTRIRPGMRITFLFSKREEPPVNSHYGILYEDKNLVVIDKPANLPVHPAGAYYENTLLNLYKEKTGEKLFFAHRLDRETSGVLLASRNSETAALLQKYWNHPQLQKEYLVLVEGCFPRVLEATGMLQDDADSAVRKKRKFVPLNPEDNAVNARTRFQRVRVYKNEISLLKATLFTGKLHQIRATLCSLGFPVVGDTLYGVDDRFYLKFIRDELTDSDRRKLRLDHTALHHARLKIPEELRVRLSLPVRFWKSPIPDYFFSAGGS